MMLVLFEFLYVVRDSCFIFVVSLLYDGINMMLFFLLMISCNFFLLILVLIFIVKKCIFVDKIGFVVFWSLMLLGVWDCCLFVMRIIILVILICVLLCFVKSFVEVSCRVLFMWVLFFKYGRMFIVVLKLVLFVWLLNWMVVVVVLLYKINVVSVLFDLMIKVFVIVLIKFFILW